jgi:hypothetical protein
MTPKKRCLPSGLADALGVDIVPFVVDALCVARVGLNRDPEDVWEVSFQRTSR